MEDVNGKQRSEDWKKIRLIAVENLHTGITQNSRTVTATVRNQAW
jgi:hypothetical protein